ncbi:MAG: M48 family metallopeptidase [Oscillospiraceae bacterium]|nr:M48 family metallopeptidase [Oscillospiraceae bacterium]
MTEFELIRSDRRTLGLQVKDGRVIVRAPRRVSEKQIRAFVAAHEEWIAGALKKQRARAEAHPEPTEAERRAYIRKAKEVLPGRVAHYSRIMGLYPTAIRITSAKTRFGSCGSNGHVCFSWRLMQYPDEAIDYVVVHELAHLKHMNHSPAFHALVASVLPDHKQRRALLRK